MQGLPGSGKSTRAAEIIKKDGNAVRVGRDQLRTMLHFDKWSGKNEKMTREAEMILAHLFVSKNKNVIVDDTNIQSKRIQEWKDFAKAREVKISYERMKTPIEECIIRDSKREKSIGRDVIVAMALQAGLYPKPKGFVLCDLDGTLCDIRHRLHFVQQEPKDWKSFFNALSEDSVREDVRNLVLAAKKDGYEIVFVSGRSDDYRKKTKAWINNAFYGDEIATTLLMRRSNDSRPDTEVKKQIYETYFKAQGYPVKYVIDDRPSVIRMWRENGLEVIDVGDGIEF